MKTRIIFLFLFLFILQNAISQIKKDTATQNSIRRLEKRIENREIDDKQITQSIQDISNRISTQQTINEQILNGISLQIESATYNLTIFGLLFALAALGLGAYVTYVERTVVKISDENKVLLAKNERIKDDIEEINRLIQSDIYNLFLKIKREETVHILDRLINVPKDVANVCETLLSRELLQEDFTKLKKAYINLTGNSYKYYYHTLFFQHFLSQSLKDEELRNAMAEFIPTAIDAAFENDIIKSTGDFTTTIVDRGLQEFASEINQFFNGISNSKYSNFEEAYKVLFEKLQSRQNRFDIWSVASSTDENRKAKINYGKLLQDKYQYENLSTSESLIIQELGELILAEEEAKKEEQRQKEKNQKQKEEKK